MEAKQTQFVELSSQAHTIKRLNPVRKHNRLIKANFIPKGTDPVDTEQMSDPDDSGIELKRDGDFVEMITVNCACGRSTQILLDYDNHQASAQKVHPDEADH
ncbi:MAG: hypothetical protein V3U73_12080 [bacterium]